MRPLMAPLDSWSGQNWLPVVDFDWPILDELRDRHHDLVGRLGEATDLVRRLEKRTAELDADAERDAADDLISGEAGGPTVDADAHARLDEAKRKEADLCIELCDHAENCLTTLQGRRREAYELLAEAHPETVPPPMTGAVPVTALEARGSATPPSERALNGWYRMKAALAQYGEGPFKSIEATRARAVDELERLAPVVA